MPLGEALQTWLEAELARISAKSALAGAIRCALRHWQRLTLFLGNGLVETDNKHHRAQHSADQARPQKPPLR